MVFQYMIHTNCSLCSQGPRVTGISQFYCYVNCRASMWYPVCPFLQEMKMPSITDQDTLVERSKFALILYGRL